jgi:hypothetical protein
MINEARKPSEALLNIILADLQASVIDFIENKEVVEN